MRYEKNEFVFQHVKYVGSKSIWRVTIGGVFFAHVGTDAVIRALNT